MLEIKHEVSSSSQINETVCHFFFLKDRKDSLWWEIYMLLCLILQMSSNKCSTLIFISLKTYMLYRSDISPHETLENKNPPCKTILTPSIKQHEKQVMEDILHLLKQCIYKTRMWFHTFD